MGLPGRKSTTEELKITERWAELTEPFFKILEEFATSKNKVDRKWAGEQMAKGFVKMIPQAIKGTGEDGLINVGVIYLPRRDGKGKVETTSRTAK